MKFYKPTVYKTGPISKNKFFATYMEKLILVYFYEKPIGDLATFNK